MKSYSVNELTTASGKARVTLTKRLADAPRGEDGKIALADVLDAFERFGAGNAGKLNLQEENAKLAREKRLALEAARAEREGTIQGSVTNAACMEHSAIFGEWLAKLSWHFIEGVAPQVAETDTPYEVCEQVHNALYFSIGNTMAMLHNTLPKPYRDGLVQGFSKQWFHNETEACEHWITLLSEMLGRINKLDIEGKLDESE